MDKIICDASPLIVLAKADLLELLPNQFSERHSQKQGLRKPKWHGGWS